MHFDYTQQGRRPSAKQIVGAWLKAGKPAAFTVEYGETFAQFERGVGRWGNVDLWTDSGNGQRGVDRNAVVKLLNQKG